MESIIQRMVDSSEHIDDVIEKMNEYGRRETPFLFVIDYEMQSPFVIPIEDLGDFDIEVAIHGTSYTKGDFVVPRAFDFLSFPPTFSAYLRAFESIQKHFILGNTYLANLTFPSRIETDLSLREIYSLSHARYKLRVEDRFVVFSPESFVRIADDEIASFPMKGTIDADIPNSRSIILADEKETAEHITIVDLIRNDIGMIANPVRVERFRYIDRISTHRKTLLQVSSEIRGKLRPGWHGRIGTILASLLPAGSICGAPKTKTVEIIRDAEIDQRGYYTGVFGVFDGTSLESGVMIRFIEQSSGCFTYRSGGGLTVDSDPVLEYEELIDKIYVPVTRNHTTRGETILESRAPREEDARIPSEPVRSR